MRNPLDVLIGRVEAKANRKVLDVKVKARQAAEQKARSVVTRGKGQAAGGAGAAPGGKKKKKMGWWPFGGEGGEGAAPSACPSCGKDTDPSWAACPYCQAPLQAAEPAAAQMPAGQAPLPMSAQPVAPVAQGVAQRTMAVDIESLRGPRKEVMGWLVCMVGNQKGMDFRLYPGKNGIGAAADNEIVVTDEYLSSKHAMIRVERDGDAAEYWLHDVESTNGCYLNEKRVTKEELIDNDTVRLGRTEFRFRALY